jgi:SAM-dependent methyltransferase
MNLGDKSLNCMIPNHNGLSKMNEESTHPLNFLSGFEDSRPDAYHHVDFTYAKDWIKEKRVLNIGCWTGSFETLSTGLPRKAFGLDQDINALGVAKKSHPTVSFVNGDLFDLPFTDNSIETVLLFTVFEHLGGRERDALKEIHRVLKPNGNLILSTPHKHWLHGVMDVAHWLVNHHHFRTNEIKEHLSSTGFNLAKLNLRGKWISTLCIPWFYLAKYFLRTNIYKSALYRRLLINEYDLDGFRDIYLVAEKR